MNKSIKIDWMEFLNHNLCSLCGNRGYIDTTGIKSPAVLNAEKSIIAFVRMVDK